MGHKALEMALRAVIFDLDGVIVSTDAMHYRAWKSVADDEGIYFDERINNRLRGVSRMESLEIILERAKEAFPEARPRIISDNGPQFIAKDFKEFIRISGMTHVRTSPYYPQSNGKVERWHGSLKSECIRPGTPLSLDDARRLVAGYVEHYNEVRLHSAIGFVTPSTMLQGRAPQIFAERDRKLEAAREQRKARRQAARKEVLEQPSCEALALVAN